MIIRSFKESDIKQLTEIHEKFYKDQFNLIEFCHKFIDFFVVENDERIVTIGGLRAIAESVIMTNKDMTPRMRRAALYQMLEAQLFTCKKLGYNGINAFVQETDWEQQLLKVGFKPCKGHAIFLEVK